MTRTITSALAGGAVAASIMVGLGWIQQGAAPQRPAAAAQQPPASGQPQEKPAQGDRGDLSQIGPRLIAALKATKGCLGVDAGQMSSGKNAIFAWFENKKAAQTWYYSDLHQHLIAKFFPNGPPAGGAGDDKAAAREPMEGVPDNVPLLVIASLTPTDAAKLKETNLPISQIAIEMYAPVSGGLFLGSRFAPDALKVPDMRDYTPKAKTETPKERQP